MSEPYLPADWPHTKHAGRLPRRKWQRWDEERTAKFKKLWLEGAPLDMIADECSIAWHSIPAKAAGFGLPPRNGRAKRKKSVGNGQRRHSIVHNGTGPKITLEPYHPAYRKGTTFFPSTVIAASKVSKILKSGQNSPKIGARVEKGRWKGMPIFTLTLEERDTCPRSCTEWATCYGNNMHWAQRIHDDGTLTRRLWGELASIQAENMGGFVVRLHVLGDFYSTEYVRFWREALSGLDFPALRIFGFTARRPPDPIGIELVHLVADFPDKCILRFSGSGLDTHGSEVVDVEEEATQIICPAQKDENRCCASCALCWQSIRSITFLRH